MSLQNQNINLRTKKKKGEVAVTSNRFLGPMPPGLRPFGRLPLPSQQGSQTGQDMSHHHPGFSMVHGHHHPGARAMVPGMPGIFPGMPGVFPGVFPGVTGGVPGFPGVVPGFPGVVPGGVPGFPGVVPGFPGETGVVPGSPGGFPGFHGHGFGFSIGNQPMMCQHCVINCHVLRGDYRPASLERYGSNLYYFSKAGSNKHYDAEFKCRYWFNGHLASIHTDYEYNWIKKKMHKKRRTSEWRFGGNKNWGFWLWTDGTPKFWDIKWYNDRPKKGDSLISRGGGVVDVELDEKIKYFVCKKPCAWVMPQPQQVQAGGQQSQQRQQQVQGRGQQPQQSQQQVKFGQQKPQQRVPPQVLQQNRG